MTKIIYKRCCYFFFITIAIQSVVSCSSVEFFPVREYYGDKRIKFNQDHSYEYFDWVTDGYVYAFSKGRWRQEGKNIFLFNESIPGKLPISIRKDISDNPDVQLVVNLLPKKKFDHLPSSIEVVNVELVLDNVSYPVISETSVIKLQKPFERGYFKLYSKPNADIAVKILRDTLRSQDFSITETKNATISIDVDCNPYYFAQVKIPDDTLRIISDRKIKWNKIYLERPR